MTAPKYLNTSWLKLAMQSGRMLFDNGYPEISHLPVSVGTIQAVTSATPVAVADTNVTASSQIMITAKTVSGTPAAPFIKSITPGTGFSVTFGSSDATLYNYAIIG